MYAGTLVRMTSRQHDRFVDVLVAWLIRLSRSYVSHISSRHLPCLLWDTGCSKAQFTSQRQIMFSHTDVAWSSAEKSSFVKVALSTDGGFYALISVNLL